MRILYFLVLIGLLFIPLTQCQDVCESLIVDGIITLDRETLETLPEQEDSIQDVVDCLPVDGSLILAIGSLRLRSPILVNRAIRIRSSDRTSLVCVDNNAVFDINATGVKIRDVSIRGCDYQGAEALVTVRRDAALRMDAVRFVGNKNADGSAAILVRPNAEITIRDSLFRRNDGTAASAIRLRRGSSATVIRTRFESNRGASCIDAFDIETLTIAESNFTENTAVKSGACLHVVHGGNESISAVELSRGSFFNKNSVKKGDGGAVYINGSVSLVVSGETFFARNTSPRRGGAIYAEDSSNITVSDAYFIENESKLSGGGAIYAETFSDKDVFVTVSNSTFSMNMASNYLGSGGAIRLKGPGMSCSLMESVSFIINRAELDGGAVHVSGIKKLSVTKASFVGNEALSGGAGGIYAVSIENLGAETIEIEIDQSKFLFNRALSTSRGGATIGGVGFGAEFTITNSEFLDNDAGKGSGGALYLFSGPVADIKNCNFTRNRGTQGGALYAENDARYTIKDCRFTDSTADEGGAIHIRGDVDLELSNTAFERNTAVTDGGAIKVFNFRTGGDETAVLDISSCTFDRNVAGLNLVEDGLYGTETSGGALAVIGSGVDLNLGNNTFRKNEASQGGAVSIRAPRDISFEETGKNSFIDNGASYGGAIFLRVDENVVPTRESKYTLSMAVYKKNTALLMGGAVFIAASKVAVDGLSVNARSYLVEIIDSNFTQNMAERAGGAVAIDGAGVEIKKCKFNRNHAKPVGNSHTTGSESNKDSVPPESEVAEDESTSSSVVVQSGLGQRPDRTRGGALHVENGGVVIIMESTLTSNTADFGGGASVFDASLKSVRVNITDNSANSGGVGGAVAMEVSHLKDIPVLNSANRIENLIYDAVWTRFFRNNGALHGGALFLNHIDVSDPRFNLENCTSTSAGEKADTRQITCETEERYRKRLDDRIVRLANCSFTNNTAIAGPAFYLNDPEMISSLVEGDDNVKTSKVLDLIEKYSDDDCGGENRFLAVLKSECKWNVTGNNFSTNKLAEGGYGIELATPPTRAIARAFKKGDETPDVEIGNLESGVLVLDDYTSGSRLKLNVSFQDHFDQTVSVDSGMMAEIIPRNDEATISGQFSARMDPKGRVEFGDVRLRGQLGRTFKFQIVYRPTDDNLSYSVPQTKLTVTMRECRIGEMHDKENDECELCPPDTFTDVPDNGECSTCADRPIRCYGDYIIPNVGYWVPTSTSMNAKRCAGRYACLVGRNEIVRPKAIKAHRNNNRIDYTSEENSDILCTENHRGILCGSCKTNTGKENNRCLRCRSLGLRTFLLLFFVTISFAFLSYFIRSVLLLSTRIDFNERFKRLRQAHHQRFIEVRNPMNVTPATQAVDVQIYSDDENVLRGEPSARNLVHGNAPIESPNMPADPTQRTRRDIARCVANRLQAERKAHPDGSHHHECDVERNSRRRGRLAQMVKNVKTGNLECEMEPLTLANPVAEILKILVNFLQVTSVALALSFDWTDVLRDVLAFLGTVSSVSSGAGYLSLDCFLSDDGPPKSIRRMVITILYPLIILVFYVILWSVITIAKQETKRFFLQRIWLTYLAVNYFVYINMTRNLLRFFSCVDVPDADDEEHHVWEEDPDVTCFNRDHAVVVALLVVPLVLVVTFGFPVGIYIILSRNKNLLDNKDFIATYGFLYRAYDKHYWEVAVLLRKGLIAIVVVFSHRLEENLQGLLCLLVLIVAFAAHLIALPFTSDIEHLNSLEGLSLFTTILVFFTGLVMNDNNTAESFRAILTAISVLLVVFTVGIMLIRLLQASEELIDMMLIEKEVMELEAIVEARLSKKCEELFLYYLRKVWNGVEKIWSAVCIRPSKDSAPRINAPEELQMERTGTKVPVSSQL